eukprot:CAMPEP_0119112928 /NCGR_PEP_ID=MMETSP1180-20130426/42235_1 /TAXON_ID=3052 ORGANISM="Chlamydomonas cf sp, Strain CCMP681" /NCGR_SAMPLE_ID=MMETSP1180 /ASSEMBLY_ACC=CAM_ASM_000741 /LENGTH=361 /DNA_ID=CAMNT_0007100711 /DNA_START=28 /DNA_END=1113 /DNA_ORIENTATION=+
MASAAALGVRHFGHARAATRAVAAPVVAKAALLTPYGNVLPEQVHQVLRHQNMKPGRLVVVGDVHGCCEELKMLLKKLDYLPDTDNLIFVGDLVNKGPDSIGVLRAYQQLRAQAVRGNHDDASLRRWHAWTRGEELAPHSEWLKEATESDMNIIEGLPFSLTLPEYGVVLVHGGVVPKASTGQVPHLSDHPSTASGSDQCDTTARLLEQQVLKDMVCMRNVVPQAPASQQDGSMHPAWLATSDTADGHAWAQMWHGPWHIMFGHDAKRRLQLAPNATGLDTGCVYGGKLTAVVLPPLPHLVASSPVVAAHARAAQYTTSGKPGTEPEGPAATLPAVTREDLQVELVCVAAIRQHVPIGKGD